MFLIPYVLHTFYTPFQDNLVYGHKDLTLKTIYESLSSMEIMNYMADGQTTQLEGLVLQGHDHERENSGPEVQIKVKELKEYMNLEQEEKAH